MRQATKKGPDAGTAPQAGGTSTVSLRVGLVTEVMTLENRLLFVGRIDAIADGAIAIREVSGGELPMLICNRTLKLRFYRDRDNIVLRAKVRGSSARIVKVDRLESTFVQEQRAFFRQSVSVALNAKCINFADRNDTSVPMSPCQVLDISAGGILISCSAPFLKGDRLLITGVPLLPEAAPFNFVCVIRRADQWENATYRYGCQFLSLTTQEQERLLQAIFAIQREEIRRRKNQ